MAREKEQHLRGLRDSHQRRLRVLERQQATFGLSVDPAIVTEIELIQEKLAEIDAVLAPPAQIRTEIWDVMGADDQRRYLVRLVMELQADFVSCRLRLNREVKMWLGIILVVLAFTFFVLLLHAYMMRGFG